MWGLRLICRLLLLLPRLLFALLLLFRVLVALLLQGLRLPTLIFLGLGVQPLALLLRLPLRLKPGV
jgi:hypothetical protein